MGAPRDPVQRTRVGAPPPPRPQLRARALSLGADHPHPTPQPRCRFGLVKGALMAPFVITWHVLGVLLTNLLMTFTFLDHGYAALRL